MDYVVYSYRTEDTQELGRILGAVLQGGDVLCLEGDLGAGKTALAQGIAVALGIKEAVTSPTFTLMQEYSAQAAEKEVRMIHMDLYRLQYPEEVGVIGVEDAFQSDSICLIEWPEIAEDYLPEDCLELRIEGSGEDTRKISFLFKGENWQERLEKVIKKYGAVERGLENP